MLLDLARLLGGEAAAKLDDLDAGANEVVGGSNSLVNSLDANDGRMELREDSSALCRAGR